MKKFFGIGLFLVIAYEKNMMEQQKRTEELEQKISEIYSRWDEY